MQNTNESTLDKYSEFIEPDLYSSFKAFLAAEDKAELEATALKIGSYFGSPMKKLLSESSEERTQAAEKLVKSFYNNIKLLVQKTWVEKPDETVKEQIVTKLDSICEELKKENYTEEYSDIIAILDEAVILMFGDNSTTKEEFAEYALRIDPDFGAFWCFLQCLPAKAEWQSDKIRLALLLEISFIANY
ncbi:MAG: hypothetical protein K5839_03685 [Treponemataceae bacterium]|nr:hypothetical protein [Treponemataceae bacterium]